MPGHKRFHIPLAILIVVIAASVACFVWYHRSPEEVASAAAAESQVGIPEGASAVSANHDRIRIQGGCSQLTFLLPTTQWRGYVGEYIRDPLVPSSYRPISTCDDIAAVCLKQATPEGLSGYETEDEIDGKRRYLYVIPDCEPGKTLISWNTFDL